jgi:hypothetical protein
MLLTRLGTFASLGMLAGALLLSCGTDEGTSPDGHAGTAGNSEAAAAGVGDPTSTGGTNDGGTSSSGSGGTSAGKSAGGSGGSVASVGAAGNAQAGAGGVPIVTGEGEQLEVCNRLTGLVPHADNTARAYLKSVNRDCRVKWVIPLAMGDFAAYRNRLVSWNLEFWGCQGTAVTELALVYQQPDLSKGDAELLVQYYLDAADAELDLSPAEHADMKAALERLAEPLVTSDSEQPSQPNCPVDTGTGGAGGAGPEATAGAAGMAPQVGGAPTSGGSSTVPSAGQGGAL